jgi:predicted N-formylglutamate amidohydrolase
MKKDFNFELDNHRYENVAERIGVLFGEKGRAIGRMIDNLTKNITISVNTNDKNGNDSNKSWDVEGSL